MIGELVAAGRAQANKLTLFMFAECRDPGRSLQGIRNFIVSWSCRALAVGRVAPPGMATALANQGAAMLAEMLKKIVPLHSVRLTSS